MKTRFLILFFVFIFLGMSCKQESIGPVNGILVVYSNSLAEFIDAGGLRDLHLVVETVDPEEVFSFSFAEVSEFHGTLKERRIILLLLDETDKHLFPGSFTELTSGVQGGSDIWAIDQQVFGIIVNPTSPQLPVGLVSLLEEAYNNQMNDYIYESFVSTSMTSQARMDSILSLGFTINIPKSYSVDNWSPEDGFIQYQRQPNDECLLLFSIRTLTTSVELSDSNAVLAREAMARLFFFDSAADSVDRSRISMRSIEYSGLPGWEITGVWRNPEYLNAGAFTTRVLDAGEEWYIFDMEVYNPGMKKESFLREGWIIMDTFFKE